jgi:hypothetical protein
MIEKVTLQPDQWHKLTDSTAGIYWHSGTLRISVNATEPADQFDSVTMAAKGATRGFVNNRDQALWVYPVGKAVEVAVCRLSVSALFMIDTVGNVILDGV